jgi:hypothetical protein
VNFNTDGGMNNGSPAVNNLSINVNNGATINLASTQHLAQLTVAGGLAKLTASGAKVLEATSVSAAGGKLDLTSNRLIVDYAPGNSPMASIRQQIISGYNAGGALWGGNGIVSSSAALNPTSVGLGYAEASEVLLNGATYGGESVDGSAVLVQYTLLGDATLDGVVDFNDLVKLAQNYNTTVSASTQSWWNHGDFTYDGVVDFNDLVKLAQNYNTSLPGAAVPGAPASFSQDLAAAFAQAPEPGTLGALGIVGAIGLMRRRTRRGR